MVALNLPMSGRIGSTKGIDEQCWRQSLAANLTGKYRGFISNRLQHVYSIVHKKDRNLPVGNLQVVDSVVCIANIHSLDTVRPRYNDMPRKQ